MAMSKSSGNDEVIEKSVEESERCLRALRTVIGVHH